MKNRSTCTNIEQEPLAQSNPLDDGETVTETIQDEPENETTTELETSQTADSSPHIRVGKRTYKQNDQVAIRRFIQNAEKRSKERDAMRKAVLQHDSPHPLQGDALYQFYLSMYYTAKGLPVKYQLRIRNRIYEAVSQTEEEYDFEATTSTRTPTFGPSFSKETASSSLRFPEKTPNNIIYEAFSQAGGENDFEAITSLPCLSPSYSERTGSSTSCSATLPQSSPALVEENEETQETLITSGSFMCL